MRFCFLGSPPFATPILERLLGSRFMPSLVITPPDRAKGRGRTVQRSAIAALAEGAGVPVLQPHTVRDPEVIERLAREEADVFVVASYGEFLRQEFLDLPRDVCLNVHPSLLPRHRGATPIPAALLAGDEETGVSIQRVVLKLDAGDILVQKTLRILPGETTGELGVRLAELSGEAVLESLEKIESGQAVYTPQDPDQVTMCTKLTKEDGRIDWSRSAREIDRHVRAMNPWPGARTSLPDGRALALWRVQVLPAAELDSEPGTLLQTQGRLVVATGQGPLELIEIQAAGKARMQAEAFLLGARLEAGERLGAGS